MRQGISSLAAAPLAPFGWGVSLRSSGGCPPTRSQALRSLPHSALQSQGSKIFSTVSPLNQSIRIVAHQLHGILRVSAASICLTFILDVCEGLRSAICNDRQVHHLPPQPRSAGEAFSIILPLSSDRRDTLARIATCHEDAPRVDVVQTRQIVPIHKTRVPDRSLSLGCQTLNPQAKSRSTAGISHMVSQHMLA